jgi:hypothetical protein
MKHLVCLGAALAAVLSGCSKKEAVEEFKNPNAVPSAAVAPVIESVQKDLEAKNFEKATASMLQMQPMGPMLSEKDSLRYQGQMRNLQQSVMEAAARGDANAQKAMMMLKMMSPENQGR